MRKVLLVDDEDRFRQSLAKRLRLRGYHVIDVNNGIDAINRARTDHDIEVAVIDIRMPQMDGIATLKEIKTFRPALQAVMLTGHGTVDSAKEAGRLDAFKYLQKPCDIEELTQAIDDAHNEVVLARDRHEIPQRRHRRNLIDWFLGSHNSRPLFILLGLMLFCGVLLLPTPERLVTLVGDEKVAVDASHTPRALKTGYASYRHMKVGESIASYYSDQYGFSTLVKAGDGSSVTAPLLPKTVAFRAQAMLAVILISILFWASNAVPMAVTALIVAVVMYFFDVLRPDDIAQAFAKDAVVFIFGVLALAKAISSTGLDRRISLWLLAPARNLTLLLLVFLPLFSMACSFFSENALMAFTMPVFIMVYATAVRAAGIKQDKSLMVLFVLSLCFAANAGGPGSPASGGRNAIMVSILSDYGVSPTFGEWTKYGLPFVPVMAMVIGLYFWFVVRPRTLVGKLDLAAVVRRSAERIGPMTRAETITAAVLLLVMVLWIGWGHTLGMGGPALLGLVLLNVFRVLPWKVMATIRWEVVLLYAGASAIGKGLAVTGGALYVADRFLSILPASLSSGTGLAIASSLFTGLATNFMNDSATVTAIGPVTVPMATIAGVHPWAVGFATAFASSFAHMLIIGTPSNALAYALAKDPITGEQLVTLRDFMKHGAAILVLSFLVLWFWAILGYWRWLGFPAL